MPTKGLVKPFVGITLIKTSAFSDSQAPTLKKGRASAMLKIFLTADNHIGLKYAGHASSAVLAACRISAFEEMVRAASSENCDLFVIAGDLFDKPSGISKKTIKTLLDALARFNGTVVVLPGNHDYYNNDAEVWRYFKELNATYDNTLLLTDYRPYPLTISEESVTIYPALCTSLHSEQGQNNLGWIKNTEIPDNGAYHIGIAHGAVAGETIDREGQYFLMTRDELEKIPMDVWLIGHTHVPFPRNLTENFASAGKIFNAGTHVQTDVNCNTEGQCFIIEIDAEKNIRAKRFVSGSIRFYRKEIVLKAGEMTEILTRELADIDDNSVVELILSGAVTAEEYENRHAVVEKELSRFIEGAYSDYNLSRLISRELIESEFPETSFSAELLTTLLSEPKEAQLLYELLNSLKEGK